MTSDSVVDAMWQLFWEAPCANQLLCKCTEAGQAHIGRDRRYKSHTCNTTKSIESFQES